MRFQRPRLVRSPDSGAGIGSAAARGIPHAAASVSGNGGFHPYRSLWFRAGWWRRGTARCLELEDFGGLVV